VRDQPRPTIRDVAARAGVSVATVSRVMNAKDDVSDDARERVRAAATALGYGRGPGRPVASRRHGLIGVVVGDSGHPDLSVMFFGRVLAAIARRLVRAGYEPVLLPAVDGRADPHTGQTQLARRFDGTILIGMGADAPIVQEVIDAELPCVGVDVRCDSPRAGYVGSDHVEGIRLAVRHLYALGHRRIAHIAGSQNTVSGSDRLESFHREAEVFGLDVPPDYIARGDFSSGSGYREACALLAAPSPPSAIVVASDLMALAAVRAVWEFGLVPGRDVAIVGFDDLEAAALSHPPLTTIRQDRDALGELAADHVIELAEDPRAEPRTTLLPVELVVRASSGAIQSAA
jgi:LacI family transcriptional regulator, galactose operon repressor